MHFSCVLGIFVTVLLFIECRNIRCSEKLINFHPFKEAKSGEKFTKQLKGTVDNATCQTTYVHVPLESNSTSYEFFPSVVYVKRCSGHCNPSLSCMPIKDGTRIIKVPAILRPRDHTAQRMFVLVDVEEHTECRCMCLKKEEDCTENQEYNQSECRCTCNTSDFEKNKCEKLGMIWDSDNCSCSNRNLRDVPQSTYWD